MIDKLLESAEPLRADPVIRAFYAGHTRPRFRGSAWDLEKSSQVPVLCVSFARSWARILEKKIPLTILSSRDKTAP